MVIKGKSIGHASAHAHHLMRSDQNTRIDLLEFDDSAAAPSLDAIFTEYQLLAKSLTMAKKGLYIAALNPEQDETLTPEQWKVAVDMLEKQLGLDDQPRTVVLHEKEGREHVHVVWQRTDLERERVIDDNDNYYAHERAAREIEIKFDLEITPGKLVRAKTKHKEEPHEKEPPKQKMSYEQWEQERAQRSGIDLVQFKADVLDAYHQAENGIEFAKKLEDMGFYLGRGDKKNIFMIVTPEGDAFKLTSTLEGIYAKEWKAKLSPLKPEKLKPASEISLELRSPKFEVAPQEAEAIKQKFETQIEDRKTTYGQDLNRLGATHVLEHKDVEQQRKQDSPKGVLAIVAYVTGMTKRVSRYHAMEDRARNAENSQEIKSLRQIRDNDIQEIKRERELALFALDEATKGEQPALKLRFELSRDEQALYEFQRSMFAENNYINQQLHQYDDPIYEISNELKWLEKQAVKLEGQKRDLYIAFDDFFKDGEEAYETFNDRSGFVTRIHKFEVLEKIVTNWGETWKVPLQDGEGFKYGKTPLQLEYVTHDEYFSVHTTLNHRERNFKCAMETLIEEPEKFGELNDESSFAEDSHEKRAELLKRLIEPQIRRVRSAQTRLDYKQAKIITLHSKLDILQNKRMDAYLDFSDKRLAHLRRIEKAAANLTGKQFKKLSKKEKQNLSFAREHMSDPHKRSRADDYIKKLDRPTRHSSKTKEHQDPDKLEPHI